jgi:hypothetical protein
LLFLPAPQHLYAGLADFVWRLDLSRIDQQGLQIASESAAATAAISSAASACPAAHILGQVARTEAAAGRLEGLSPGSVVATAEEASEILQSSSLITAYEGGLQEKLSVLGGLAADLAGGRGSGTSGADARVASAQLLQGLSEVQVGSTNSWQYIPNHPRNACILSRWWLFK